VIKIVEMSDLPALKLFEEIQGLSNSLDFYGFNTKEDQTRTWSLYDQDDENVRQQTDGANTTNVATLSGKSSPARDAWDPMLYNINLTTFVEINIDEDAQVCQQPVLETPITPLPGIEELQMILNITHQEFSRSRQQSFSDSLSGSASLMSQKVK